MNARKAVTVTVITGLACLMLPVAGCLDDSATLAPPTLPEDETTTPPIESVQGDVNIVYPVVPDDGKTAGVVTMPPQKTATTSTPKTSSPSSQPGYTAMLDFKPFDARGYVGTPPYGTIILTVKCAPDNQIKVKLIGPTSTAVKDAPWHVDIAGSSGIIVTTWEIMAPGEYVADGTLLTPSVVPFNTRTVIP